MSVLEDLWFDNLIVNDVEIKKGSEAERVLSAMVCRDNALEGTLTEQQKEQFQNGKDLSGYTFPSRWRRRSPAPSDRSTAF